MQEIWKIKRAQELRVDEVSVQKWRENQETIQQLTSRLQQMQEQMNSMDGSGDFQDAESKTSVRLSHVLCQPVRIPSSRSLISRDQRLPLDTWNQSGVQEHNSLRKQCNGSKKWSWLIHWRNWSPRDQFVQKDFPNVEMVDAKIASALNKVIQKSRFMKKVGLQEHKVQKEDRFLSRTTDRLHDQRLLSSDWCSWYSIGLCWIILCHSCNIQGFDTRWDEFLVSMSKIPPMISWMETHQKISMPIIEIQDNCEEKYRSETSITKLWSQARENCNRSSGQESKGINRRWGRKKGICYQNSSVRKETSAISGMRVTIVQKKKENAATPSEPSFSRGRSESKKRRVSKAKVTVGPFFDNRADFFWEVPARERLVNIGIRPSANSQKQKRVIGRETSVCSRIARLMNKSQRKATTSHKRRESDDKNAVAYCENCTTIGLRLARLGCVGFSKKQSQRNPMQKVLGTFRKVRFTESTQR